MTVPPPTDYFNAVALTKARLSKWRKSGLESTDTEPSANGSRRRWPRRTTWSSSESPRPGRTSRRSPRSGKDTTSTFQTRASRPSPMPASRSPGPSRTCTPRWTSWSTAPPGTSARCTGTSTRPPASRRSSREGRTTASPGSRSTRPPTTPNPGARSFPASSPATPPDCSGR